MKKLIAIAALLTVSAVASADNCPTDLSALCETASNMKQHEGILVQINPAPGVRFDQVEKDGFVSVNDRAELAGQRYGADGENAALAVKKSATALKALASKKREPIYLLISRNGRVLTGGEIKLSQTFQ